jgi:hypothetical protein
VPLNPDLPAAFSTCTILVRSTSVARQSGWWRATIRMGTCDTA